MVHLFWHCPTDVLVHEIFPYLGIKDVCRLDCAASACRLLRPLLRQLYPLLVPAHRALPHSHASCLTHRVHCSRRQLQWFFARGIALQQILWTEETSVKEISATLALLLRESRSRQSHWPALALYEVDLSGCRGDAGKGMAGCSALRLYWQNGDLLAACAGHLTSLSLRHCSALSGELLSLVASCHPRLLALDLSHSRQWRECMGYASAPPLPPLLHSLNLRDCSELSDNSLIALISPRCVQLTAIDLSHCCNITDCLLFAVAVCCPRLESIRLRRCFRISAAAVIGLCTSCPSLTLLDLSHCDLFAPDDSDPRHDLEQLLSDSAVSTLSLTSLDLSSCDGVTDAAITALVAPHCPALTRLDLSYCRGGVSASASTLSVLASCCSALTALNLTGLSLYGSERKPAS